MRIALAQTYSIAGDFEQNLEKHLKLINRVTESNVDCIFFPELSLSAYEPKIASQLACDPDDSIFDALQNTCDQQSIVIGAGFPIKMDKGVAIGLLIFQPRKKREVYLKQFLHADEVPFFKAGKKQTYITIGDHKVTPGICYESLLPAFHEKISWSSKHVFLASVAKGAGGIKTAYNFYSKLAEKNKIHVLMVNCLGSCDNFIGSGQSAVWNPKGKQIAALDNESEGIIVYDTESESTLLL